MHSIHRRRVTPAAPKPTRPTVLVTGASRGIGRAVCVAFARAGWRVAVHYREERREAEETAARVLACGTEAEIHQADVRDRRGVDRMVRRVVTAWGGLDVAICNAGQALSALAVRLRPEQWERVIEVNLTGTFHCLQAAGRAMLRKGSGSIIVIGSFAAVQGRTGQAAYAAAKAGLLGLVRTAAQEWGARDVRVNVVFPGWHRTGLAGDAVPSPQDLTDHVLGRTPDLEEVARSVYHLATLRDVSGQVWNLDSRIF